MNIRMKSILLLLTALLFFPGINNVQAKSDDIIHFKDKNLEKALCSVYDCDGPITKEMAHELSTEDTSIYIWDKNISDLEGLEFFDGLTQVDLSNNNISNLKPLSELPNLDRLDISDNKIKGKELETLLNSMEKIDELHTFECYNNAIEDISFLKNISNPSNLRELGLSNNKINNISILKECKSLEYLYLENNRITDVTPLKNLKSNHLDLYLNDNCIIDYKPIKPLFDHMFTDRCGMELPLDRLDFYQNAVNIYCHNKEIQFPHITVYYKHQAYVEAIPLIIALGGSATYDKSTGTLTCKLNDNELIMKDFSTIYTLNGTDKRMTYEMRRMQYEIAYVAVEDFCNILGLNYQVLKERSLYNGESEVPEGFPEVVEISGYEETGRAGEYQYKVMDHQVGILRYLGSEANVVIPSQINGLSVTYIEDGAFCDDLNLVSVEIPNTVTRIGTSWGSEGVFTGCDNLISVKLKEGNEDASIGSSAFLNCSKLTSINIPGNYKIIYENAFNNCTSLKTVTLSEGVERIGAGAFAGDDALITVTIPSTMKALGYEHNDEITTDPYDMNTTGVFAYCTGLKTVTILEGKVDAYIGYHAFYECSKLESIIIPGNYKAIYNYAFYDCKKLKTVVYEKGNITNVAYQMIDQNAFEGCIRLQEVSLPETLDSIGDYAFNDCKSLKDLVIPEGVKTIGNFAFAGNSSLQSVSIPSTITSIGSFDAPRGEGGSFYECNNLSTVLLKEGAKKATIGSSTFQGCSKLTSIIIPGNYIRIGREAFMDCIGLKTVIYQNNSNPSTKQKILDYAFKGCTSLVTVSLPSTLAYLDEFIFYDCIGLKTVTIPTGVNQLIINSFIFHECNSLTSVYIGDNVKCNKYALSMSNSKAIIYTNNKAVKRITELIEFEVLPVASDYVNGTSLFGTIEITGKKKVGKVLTANIDAMAPIEATISYQWTIHDQVVSTENTYKIKESDKGKTIKVTIKGMNGTSGILTQSIVIANDKDV